MFKQIKKMVGIDRREKDHKANHEQEKQLHICVIIPYCQAEQIQFLAQIRGGSPSCWVKTFGCYYSDGGDSLEVAKQLFNEATWGQIDIEKVLFTQHYSDQLVQDQVNANISLYFLQIEDYSIRNLRKHLYKPRNSIQRMIQNYYWIPLSNLVTANLDQPLQLHKESKAIFGKQPVEKVLYPPFLQLITKPQVQDHIEKLIHS
jgi:hypothetical protein